MGEIDAALALGQISRARRAAGLPALNELQAAQFLADAAELRRLPEIEVEPTAALVPAPRRARRRPAIWLNTQ